MEQLSICIRYIDLALAIKEVFLGLHAVPKCDSETLTTIIKSCLLSLNTPLSNCQDKLTMVQLIREEILVVFKHA